ncbi:hypothetical protein B296_00035087, partial [Ensete ventricosum]
VFFAPSQKFKIVFRAPPRKLKIRIIPDVLAHGKSYELGFMKKRNGHKFCAKSHAELSFDLFFVHPPKNLKYWPFPKYKPMRSHTSLVV